MNEIELSHLIDASAIVALLTWLNTPDPPPPNTLVDNEASSLIAQGLVSLVASSHANGGSVAGSSLEKLAKLGVTVTAKSTDKTEKKLGSAEDAKDFLLQVGIPTGGDTTPPTPVVCFHFGDDVVVCVRPRVS
jgi:hypothetical protein